MRLHDGKPHYCWLPLQKRTERDSVSGEVHLRMQWSSEDLDNPADAVLNLAVDLVLHGIGLSVVESSVKALPREVNHKHAKSASVKHADPQGAEWAETVTAHLSR